MAKSQIQFECSNCGAQYTKWTGRCLECGKWGSITESQVESPKSKVLATGKKYAPAKPVKLADIIGAEVRRIPTKIGELDRVLGGGIVPGSLTLLGGEPGIGKSTLALELATAIPNTIYISGEESVEQIKLRAQRLKANSPTLRLANETNVETIVSTITELKPALVVIDSIQTISSAEAEGESGNLTQVRACTTKLMEAAKTTSTPVLIIGHVTKEGVVAGPKTLEHLVDTVLYLEGDQYHLYRILRTVKNRFGATDEVGVFQMVEGGLEEVKNPSANFLAERGENIAGNVLTCLMEGTRPILVEVQALVSKTAFGYPTRKANGFDINRLYLIIAVLQKRAGLNLEQYDIHLNIVGGLKADEPAADLAVAMAIAGAYKDKTLGADLAVFGELGLGGEIRPVPHAEKRVKECEQLGLKRAYVSANQKLKISGSRLKVVSLKNVGELFKNN